MRTGLLAEAELGCVAPHAMQDDGQFTGHRDASPGYAAVLGNLHAQARRLDHLRLRTSSVCAAS